MLAAQPAPLVLVVDDCAEIREVYAEALRIEGFRVELAQDAVEALRQALTLQPAVIVMDVRMPQLDGLAVARLLRRDARTSSIPVIVCTVEPVRAQALRAGHAFLEKPCSLRALVATIQAQLQR
jgi:CheY-like chemotaxis protein